MRVSGSGGSSYTSFLVGLYDVLFDMMVWSWYILLSYSCLSGVHRISI